MRVIVYRLLLGLSLGLAACTTPTATPTPPTETAAPQTAPTSAPLPTQPAPTGSLTYGFDPVQTVASYSVEETFISENNRLAITVGRTRDVQGSLTINFDNPSDIAFGTFTVNLLSLRSDVRRRDEALKTEWLESATYPTATFVVKSMEGFPANPQPGQDLTFQLLGDLTVRTGTQAVTWDVTAKLDGDALSGTATTFILMADLGIEPPSIAGILNVKDGVTLKLEFVLLPTE